VNGSLNALGAETVEEVEEEDGARIARIVGRKDGGVDGDTASEDSHGTTSSNHDGLCEIISLPYFLNARYETSLTSPGYMPMTVCVAPSPARSRRMLPSPDCHEDVHIGST
jgi:hypothetical protein